MKELMLTIMFDGKWEKGKGFISKSTHGLLLYPDASYEELINEIRSALELETSVEILCISYQIKDTFQPTIINSDQSLKFYLHLKLSTGPEVFKYPLCLEIKDHKLIDDVIIDNVTERLVLANTSDIQLDLNPFEYDSTNRNDIGMYTGPSTIRFSERTDSTNMLLTWLEGGGTEMVEGMDTTLRMNGIYPSKEYFKELLQIYALHNRFQFKTKTSNPEVLHVICIGERCKWAVRGIRIEGTSSFEIKRFDNVHSCPLDCRISGNRQATAAIIGKLIKHQYLDASRKPYQPKAIMADLNRELGLKMNYKKAWRGKESALNSLTGTDIGSYKKLPVLCYMIRSKNPGSVVYLNTDNEENFLTLFMSLAASIQGWKSCRPIISVDGSFLKAKFRGTILSACALDANRQIFPLAFGVCEKEKKDSWLWFFTNLKEVIGERSDLCFVSDRNEGLISALKVVFPDADHGHCVQHILGNITSKFGGKTKKVISFFNAAARAPTEKLWAFYMKLLDAEDPKIRKYLSDIGDEKWARCKFKRRRYSIVTSNNAESLNAMDATARDYPISMLIEFLFTKLQEWFLVRRDLAASNKSRLSDVCEEVLVNLMMDSTGMIVRPSTAYLFEVIDKSCRAYVVDLEAKTCTCREFDLEDFVCVHAVAAIGKRTGISCYDYISKYYHRSAWFEAYKGVIHPLGDYTAEVIPEEYTNCVVNPPISDKRTSGRPKNKRIPSTGEFVSRQTCGRCKQHGHNQKTCNNPIPRLPR